jgi:hypothetical protein
MTISVLIIRAVGLLAIQPPDMAALVQEQFVDTFSFASFFLMMLLRLYRISDR